MDLEGLHPVGRKTRDSVCDSDGQRLDRLRNNIDRGPPADARLPQAAGGSWGVGFDEEPTEWLAGVHSRKEWDQGLGAEQVGCWAGFEP